METGGSIAGCHNHTFIIAVCLYYDALYECSGQSVVFGCYRFRYYSRWGHCYDGDYPEKREDTLGQPLEESNIAKRVAEVSKPILFATIIIITAYLPLFAFERVEQKLFTPMAFTVGYALIGALLVALFLIPGMGFAIYKKPQKIYHNKWLEKLTLKYYQAMQIVVRKPKR